MLLGGRDIDRKLSEYYLKEKNLEEYMRKYYVYNTVKCTKEVEDERKIARNGMRCIQTECKKVKEKLSGIIKQTYINPDFQMLDDGRLQITLDKFKELNKDLFNSLLPPVERVLSNQKISKFNIKEIILIGGSSCIPIVKEKLSAFFGKMPYKDGEPRNAVVTGAAIDARRRYVDNQNCCKELLNLKYTDVCPLSIGVDIIGGRICKLIQKNTQLPAEGSDVFYTCSNFQTSMLFNIYETEKPIISNDSLIGNIKINVPSNQAGESKVRLKLSLDENGILSASCIAIGSFYTASKIIREGGSLNESQIQAIITSAERTKLTDNAIAEKNYLNARWRTLHNNVIAFIDKYRNSILRNKVNVLKSFDEIKIIANREKNHDVVSENYLKGMIEEYKKRFEVYNQYAPPDRKTKFLNNA